MPKCTQPKMGDGHHVYLGERPMALLSHGDGVVSMSRRGNCWDNAVMESFYSRLKVELIYAEQYRSIAKARSGIFEHIEVFYNRFKVGVTKNNPMLRIDQLKAGDPGIAL